MRYLCCKHTAHDEMGRFSSSCCGSRGSLPTLRVSAWEWGTKNKTAAPLPSQPPSLRALQAGGWQRAPQGHPTTPLSHSSQPLPWSPSGRGCSLQNLGSQALPGNRTNSIFVSLDFLEPQVVAEQGKCGVGDPGSPWCSSCALQRQELTWPSPI